MIEERGSDKGAALSAVNRPTTADLEAQIKAHYAEIEAHKAQAAALGVALELARKEQKQIAEQVRAILNQEHAQRAALGAALQAARVAHEKEQGMFKRVIADSARSAVCMPSTVITEWAYPTKLTRLHATPSGIGEAWRKVGAYLGESMIAARAKLTNE